MVISLYPVYVGCQLGLLRFSQSQLDALSAAFARAWAAVFCDFPFMPNALNIFHVEWDGNPQQPTSTVLPQGPDIFIFSVCVILLSFLPMAQLTL